MVEIEHRYVLTALPGGLGAGEVQTQSYMIVWGPVEVRLRSSTNAVLTLKFALPSNGTPKRLEIDMPIPLPLARRLHNTAALVRKTRYTSVDSAGRLWEIDVYHDDLDGLVTAELEVPHTGVTVECPWSATNVTGKPLWTNRSLARFGLPR